ncbi:MAG: hypothetical protein PHP98_01535 [Kiritimatiellae bacterium]|nr:hypothetical protein [Kiritimatiellia bacterium]
MSGLVAVLAISGSYADDLVLDGGVIYTNDAGTSNYVCFVVGSNTADNGYILTNGAVLNTTTAVVGYAGSATNNFVLVDGATWHNATNVYMGYSGSAGFNRIIITNGGLWSLGKDAIVFVGKASNPTRISEGKYVYFLASPVKF